MYEFKVRESLKCSSRDCMIFNPRREVIGDVCQISVFIDELKSLAVKMMGFVPESLDECLKFNPVQVKLEFSQSLPTFWTPRTSVRRRRSRIDDKISDSSAAPQVKKEKPTTFPCPIQGCNKMVPFKTSMGISLSINLIQRQNARFASSVVKIICRL